MQLATRHPPAVGEGRISEAETAVWILIVILLGAIGFAVFTLLQRVGG
jgi:hypothetical protein